MIDIDILKENINAFSKKLDSLNIDSIFIEQDGKLDKVFYKEKQYTVFYYLFISF